MKFNINPGDTEDSWIFDSNPVNETMNHARLKIDLANSQPWAFTYPDEDPE